MNRNFVIIAMILLYFLQIQIALAATEISGTITVKRGDTVKVAFQTHQTAGPKIGDEVKFSTSLGGVDDVYAGTGKITEIDENTVWVKVTDNNPQLKMKAVIHATGSSEKVEYTIDLPGQNWDSGWFQDAEFIFKYAKGLTVDTTGPVYAVRFPGGAYFSHPHHAVKYGVAEGSFIERSLEKFHRDRVARFQEMEREDGEDVNIVWPEHKIQGRNSVFYVTQALVTDSGLKSDRRDQRFLISFVTPKPSNYDRNYLEMVWEMVFSIPVYFDKQDRPEYWETVLLEVLQSASVINNR